MYEQPDHLGAEHATEIGSDLAARLASASCSCGWVKVIGFARPSGEPVALRLAQLEADRHQRDPDAGRWVLLVTDDPALRAAVLTLAFTDDTSMTVHPRLGVAAARGAVQAADLVLLGPDAVPTAAALCGIDHPLVAAITTDVQRHDAVMADLAGCVRLVVLPRDAAWVAAGGR